MAPTCTYAASTCSTARPFSISSPTFPAFPQKNCVAAGSPKLKREKSKAGPSFEKQKGGPASVSERGILFNFRAVVRQRLPTASALFSNHAANDSSSAMLPFNHCVIALFETRKADVSDDLRLHVAD